MSCASANRLTTALTFRLLISWVVGSLLMLFLRVAQRSTVTNNYVVEGKAAVLKIFPSLPG